MTTSTSRRTPARLYDFELERSANALKRIMTGVEPRDDEREAALLARIADLAMHRLPVSVTIGAGVTRRVSAQTAHNDHDVELEPGTYPLEWNECNRLSAAVPATECPWWNVTASFGGVAYAGEQRGGEPTTYHFDVYPYMVRDGNGTPWHDGITWNY